MCLIQIEHSFYCIVSVIDHTSMVSVFSNHHKRHLVDMSLSQHLNESIFEIFHVNKSVDRDHTAFSSYLLCEGESSPPPQRVSPLRSYGFSRFKLFHNAFWNLSVMIKGHAVNRATLGHRTQCAHIPKHTRQRDISINHTRVELRSHS